MSEMITTSHLPSTPKTPDPEREKLARSLNLRLVPFDCPRCHAPMFQKKAPCWLRNAGYKYAGKCFSCGKQVGIKEVDAR